jgi:hypothetical protein
MLFGLIKPDDWEIIHKEGTVYDVQTTYGRTFNRINIGDSREENCYTILKYSKSRNKYKISVLGYKPNNLEQDSGYQKCLDKQIELQRLQRKH